MEEKTKIFIKNQLEKRANKGTLRELSFFEGKTDFLSNDYLGYSKNPTIFENFYESLPLKKFETPTFLGSTGSRLLSGHHKKTEQFEKYLAHFFKSEDALIFNSGFSLNGGLLECLPSENDILLMDQNIHASLKMGAGLSKAKVFYFRHNDLNHLEERLKKFSGKNIFVVIESLYSMDGDIAPLKEIASLKKNYSFELIVDEAHAIGIFGALGEGLCVRENIHHQTLARIVTFGKAMGQQGAAILGNSLLKNYLVNFCQSFIYTTGISPLNIAALWSAFEYRENNHFEVEELFNNINYFKNTLNFNLKFEGPIFGITCSDISLLKEVSNDLMKENILARPIFSPTVKRGTERLRIIIHSFNTKKELDLLANILKRKLL